MKFEFYLSSALTASACPWCKDDRNARSTLGVAPRSQGEMAAWAYMMCTLHGHTVSSSGGSILIRMDSACTVHTYLGRVVVTTLCRAGP